MKDIIGWTPIYPPEPGAIVTQAFILCSRCGIAIYATSGPRRSAWCNQCVLEALMDDENKET